MNSGIHFVLTFGTVLAVLFSLASTATVTSPTPTAEIVTPGNITIVPDNVRNLHPVFASANTIGVSWTAPNDSVSVIYGYNVFINKNTVECDYGWYLTCHQGDPVYAMGQPTCYTSSTGVVSCNEQVFYNVTQLDSYTFYNISVVTSNKEVTSLPESLYGIRTGVGVPGPVSNLQIAAVDNSSIHATWTAPDHMAGPTNYSVKVLEAEHRAKGSKYIELATYFVEGYENTEFLVEDLQPSWQYQLEIAAVTSAGHSPGILSESVRTQPGIPSVVQKLKVSYATDQYMALVVSWECPLERMRRGQITHYTVQYTSNVSLTVTYGSYYTEDPCIDPHKIYLPVIPDNTYNIMVRANAEFTGIDSSTQFYADLNKMMYVLSPRSNKTSSVTDSRTVTAVSATIGSVVFVLVVVIAALLLWK